MNDCFPCPAGHWCNLTGMVNYNNSKCPIGHFCPSQLGPTLCGARRRRATPGAGSRNECDLCPGGYYCPNDTINIQGIPCRPRTYCPVGSSLEILCPGGAYCPATTSTPLPCPGMGYGVLFNLAGIHLHEKFVTIIISSRFKSLNYLVQYNKQHRWNVLLNSFYLSGTSHTSGFHPQS